MTTPAPSTDFTEAQFAILRTAVTLARNEGVRTLNQLKSRLDCIYPGREEDVKAALTFWSKDLRQRYPGGIPA